MARYSVETVTTAEGSKRTEVTLETHEWDYHVRQFMREMA
jgi:hypothetical protein